MIAVSTTTDLLTAMRYSAKDGALMRVILKLVPDKPTALHIGADVAFLSLFPSEREVLYPPGVTLVPRAIDFVGLASEADYKLSACWRALTRMGRRCKWGRADERYAFIVLECRVTVPPLEDGHGPLVVPPRVPRTATVEQGCQTE